MFAKVAVLFATLLAVNAGALLHGAALAHTGSSVSSRHQDAFGNYGFGYDVVDGHGASNSRSEVGDAHGNKQGSYTLHDIDGRARRVDYVADGLGFRAAVSTNEPGTAHSAPAAALVSSPYAAPVAPLAHHAAVAPIALAAHITAAPIAPVAHHDTVGHATPLGVAHVVPAAYSSTSVINHVAPAATVVGHVAAAPLAHHASFAPVAHHAAIAPTVQHAAIAPAVHHAAIAPVAVGHADIVATPYAIPSVYSTSSAVNHIAPFGHPVAQTGLVRHGFVGHRFGGIAYGGLKSLHY